MYANPWRICMTISLSVGSGNDFSLNISKPVYKKAKQNTTKQFGTDITMVILTHYAYGIKCARENWKRKWNLQLKRCLNDYLSLETIKEWKGHFRSGRA